MTEFLTLTTLVTLAWAVVALILGLVAHGALATDGHRTRDTSTDSPGDTEPQPRPARRVAS